MSMVMTISLSKTVVHVDKKTASTKQVKKMVPWNDLKGGRVADVAAGARLVQRFEHRSSVISHCALNRNADLLGPI